MSLRIRQVKPDFWRDSTVAVMPDTTRLVYIGLWMESDDDGWFRMNTTEIGSDLYPLTSRHLREKRVAAAVDELVTSGRITVHPCGHAHIPTLVHHQRFAAMEKRVHTIQREHQSECVEGLSRGDPRVPAETRTSPPRSVTVSNGQERNGGVRGGAPTGADLFEIKDGRLAKKETA